MNSSSKNGVQFLALEFSERQKSTVVFETGISAILCILGVLLNVFFLFALYRTVKLRKVSNVFVFEFALCDMFLSATIFPFVIWSTLHGGVASSNTVWCQIQAYWTTAVIRVSYLTIALTALNRYMCVLHPQSCDKYFRLRYTLYFLLSAWLVACSVPLFNILKGDFYKFHPGLAICVEAYDDKEQSLVKVSIFHLLPFAIAFSCYSRIYWTIQRQRRRVRVYLEDCHIRQLDSKYVNQVKTTTFELASDTPKTDKVETRGLQAVQNCQENNKTRKSSRKSTLCKISAEQIKMTKIFFVVTGCFFVCRLPVILAVMFDLTRQRMFLPRQVYLLAIYIVGVSCVVIPVLFCMMTNELRKECFIAQLYLRKFA